MDPIVKPANPKETTNYGEPDDTIPQTRANNEAEMAQGL